MSRRYHAHRREQRGWPRARLHPRGFGAVGLITGVFPALQVSKPDDDETFKARSTSRGAQLGGGRRLGLPPLNVAELAMALVLLVVAGLMIKSFVGLLAVPKGFNPDGLLTLFLNPGFAKSPGMSSQRINVYWTSTSMGCIYTTDYGRLLSSLFPMASTQSHPICRGSSESRKPLRFGDGGLGTTFLRYLT
jgi:hypothetical protein